MSCPPPTLLDTADEDAPGEAELPVQVDSDSDAADADGPAAELAAGALLQDHAAPHLEKVVEALRYLDVDAPVRGEQGGSLSFGAYVHVRAGVRALSRVYPTLTRLLTRVLRHHFPGDTFTTLVVNFDVCAAPHRDQQNSWLPSLLLPLTQFVGGGIWVESPTGLETRIFRGRRVLGAVAPLRGPTRLSARSLLHATEPWQGSRVLLVGFHLAGFRTLQLQDRAYLQQLGFLFPDEEQERRAMLSRWTPHGTQVQQALPCSAPKWPVGKLRHGCGPDVYYID